MKRAVPALFLVLLLAACATTNDTLVSPDVAHERARKALTIATKVYDATAKTAAEYYATMPDGPQREAFKANVVRIGDMYLRSARAAKFAIDSHQPSDAFTGNYREAYNYLLMLINAVNAALAPPP